MIIVRLGEIGTRHFRSHPGRECWRETKNAAVAQCLGIRDILDRIRIRGSIPLANGSGSESFLQ
jgi:hypothetical protein